MLSGRDFEVTCVSDGEAALSEAARVTPDVVLADVDLPRLDGYAFSGRLKQTPLLAQTPVILMMSRDDVYDTTKGKDAGIIDNIAKPFESQELIGKVKKALAAAPPKPAEHEKPAAVPQPAAPAASPSVEAVHSAGPAQKASTDIFDIIQEAPTESEVKKTAAPATPDEESVYEVEAEVEEVIEPITREIAKGLPVGDKAVEEMRAGLGLMDETAEIAPEIIPYESFEIAMETPAKEEISMSPPVTSHPAMPTESAAVSSTLTAVELRKIAEETISKMAKDVFAQMPPVRPPTLPESELRRMAEAAISEMAKEAFAKTPLPQPPALSASDLWSIAEETIAKMAKDVFAQMPPVQPPLPESELRRIAEAGHLRDGERGFCKNTSTAASRALGERSVEHSGTNHCEDGKGRGCRDAAGRAADNLSPTCAECADEAAAKSVKEALEKKPPLVPEDILRGSVEENVLKVVNEAMGKTGIPKPPTLPESELRIMAETTLSKMASDVSKTCRHRRCRKSPMKQLEEGSNRFFRRSPARWQKK